MTRNNEQQMTIDEIRQPGRPDTGRTSASGSLNGPTTQLTYVVVKQPCNAVQTFILTSSSDQNHPPSLSRLAPLTLPLPPPHPPSHHPPPRINVAAFAFLYVYYQQQRQQHTFHYTQFFPRSLARDSIYAIARYMPSPVRLSVRPSHGWISQRRLKLGSRNLHQRVAP